MPTKAKKLGLACYLNPEIVSWFRLNLPNLIFALSLSIPEYIKCLGSFSITGFYSIKDSSTKEKLIFSYD